MFIELTGNAIVAITENKMLVKKVKEQTSDEIVIELCDMYIDLAEAITDNLKDDK